MQSMLKSNSTVHVLLKYMPSFSVFFNVSAPCRCRTRLVQMLSFSAFNDSDLRRSNLVMLQIFSSFFNLLILILIAVTMKKTNSVYKPTVYVARVVFQSLKYSWQTAPYISATIATISTKGTFSCRLSLRVDPFLRWPAPKSFSQTHRFQLTGKIIEREFLDLFGRQTAGQ